MHYHKDWGIISTLVRKHRIESMRSNHMKEVVHQIISDDFTHEGHFSLVRGNTCFCYSCFNLFRQARDETINVVYSTKYFEKFKINSESIVQRWRTKHVIMNLTYSSGILCLMWLMYRLKTPSPEKRHGTTTTLVVLLS